MSRFGCSDTVTTDRRRQYECTLFAAIDRILGARHSRTTKYHPCAIGMVERLHRQLKAALASRLNCAHWVDSLPLGLLGLRAVLRADLQCSAAELLYASSLRLPADFSISAQLPAQPQDFLQRLVDNAKDLRPILPRPHHHNTIIVHRDLATSTHVKFVCRDAVRAPLTSAYDGPFRVLRRTLKTATLFQNGHEECQYGPP
ncbi:uncharacterized protein LOC144129666 [Amblyomma americanum]